MICNSKVEEVRNFPLVVVDLHLALVEVAFCWWRVEREVGEQHRHFGMVVPLGLELVELQNLLASLVGPDRVEEVPFHWEDEGLPFELELEVRVRVQVQEEEELLLVLVDRVREQHPVVLLPYQDLDLRDHQVLDLHRHDR